jgi:hypothetical protein
MIEVLVLYGSWKLMTALCEKRGQAPLIWCILMVLLYFVGAICGLVIALNTLDHDGKAYGKLIGFAYLGALSGVALTFMVVLVITTLQDIISGGRRDHLLGDDIDPELLLRKKVKKRKIRRAPPPVTSPFDEKTDRDRDDDRPRRIKRRREDP